MKKVYIAPSITIEDIIIEESILTASPDTHRDSDGGGPNGNIGTTTGGDDDDDSGESCAKGFTFAENDFDFEFSL